MTRQGLGILAASTLLVGTLAACGDGSFEQQIGFTTPVKYDTSYDNLSGKDSTQVGSKKFPKVRMAVGYEYNRPMAGYTGRYRHAVIRAWWEHSGPMRDSDTTGMGALTSAGFEVETDCTPGFVRVRLLSLRTVGGSHPSAPPDSEFAAMLDRAHRWHRPTSADEPFGPPFTRSVCAN